MRRTLSALFALVLLFGLVLPAAAAAPAAPLDGTVSLTGVAYSETFDTLAASGTGTATPNGWAFAESGTSLNTTYTAGTGSGNAGDTYSFGASGATERAFGGLQSGSLVPTIGAWFTNNTGAAIGTLNVAYNCEHWRIGASSRGAADRLDFQVSLDATSLTSGTWVDVDALDCASAVLSGTAGALDGNTNRTAVSNAITGLSIANGSSFWIRWNDFNITSSDDGLGVDDFQLTTAGAVDTAPTVTGTSPIDGATGVALNSDISITFSEPVTVSGTWYAISCATSSSHTAAVTGGPTTFTLNPDTNFSLGEVCAVTVVAAQVVDQDATPNPMAADYAFSFTTTAGITKISAIQGSGSAASAGTFTVEAIVVGDFQGVTGVDDFKLDGFFLQEEDADADADLATSEGIFVFCQTCPTNVVVGDKVQVTGATSEYFNMSQLNATTAGSVVVVSTGNPLPTPAALTLPVPGVTATDLAGATSQINAYYEAFEGMLVTSPATLSVTEYFELFRYGQLVLAQGGRFRQYTDLSAPAAAGYTAHQIDLARRKVILDDDSNQQNHALSENPDIPVYHPLPGFSVTNYARGGDTIANLTGVLHWSFAGLTGTDAWRIRPVPEGFTYTFSRPNPRPAAPALAGNLKVASFNLLNYFTTLNSRGAHSTAELDRQAQKIVAALTGLNADVIGVMEVENNGTAIADLVARLNAAAGAGTYAHVATGAVGTDEITVGILYKPARVTPVGAFAALTDAAFTDPNNTGSQKSRPAVAQTFEDKAWGERFTVVVNHLKSKGSCPTSGPDTDQGDGQGCWNDTRAKGASYLVNMWLPADPTGSGDPDVIILGDLNSYRREDPITSIKNASYTDLINRDTGAGGYGYLFDGQLGYLDHALASAPFATQALAATEWHINADEVNLLDYNDTIQDPGEAAFDAKPTATELFAPNAYRSSDHDPVLVGVELLPDLSDGPATFPLAWHTGQGAIRLGSLWTREATTSPGADNASDDGVKVAPGMAWNETNGGKVLVTVTGGTGFLSAWFDWNNDGSFDPSERAVTNAQLGPGVDQVVAFPIPAGVTVSGLLNARFRLYGAPQLTAPAVPDGRGNGGEVEDYAFGFGPNAVSVRGFSAMAETARAWPAALFGVLALGAVFVWRRRR